MILRTPPPSKKQRLASTPAGPENPIVIYEDPSPSSTQLVADSTASQPFLCTYQCQQMVKADFMEALSNAEKEVVEYRTKFEELNSSFSQADSERKSFRGQFMNLQQELAAATARERLLQEQLLNDVNQSQERYKKQLEIQNKLEAKLENERIAREKLEHEAASANSLVIELEGKLRNLLESQEREKMHVKNNLIQTKRESESCVSKLELDLESMEFRAKHAENEARVLNEKLDTMNMRLKESLNEQGELQKKLLGFSYKECSSDENSVLIKHLQVELRKNEYEVREAKKLKKYHEEVEVLREKLLEEKSRREKAQAELLRLQSAELIAKQLEDELSYFKSILKSLPDVSCADDIPLKFSAMQKEIIDNMKNFGETNALLKKLEVDLDAAQNDKTRAQKDVAIANERNEALKQEMKQMSLLLSSVTVERDAFMKLTEESKKERSDLPEKEMRNNSIFRELESALVKKESCIKELENEMLKSREVTHHQLLDIELLNDKINTEARRLKSLERENDRLLQQIALLESKLGHGDFCGESTKVLRMVNSPSLDAEAKQTIEALNTELKKTKEKLSAVEELNTHFGSDGKLVDSYISGKITQLKDQVATLEKREERYKTVFADRISVFRRACGELFGYKIVMDENQRPNGIPVTRFTLKSIFADSDEEKLEFDYESGNISILANEYTSQSEISRQVEIFVRRMNSIPAFTANLTIESFNKRTLS